MWIPIGIFNYILFSVVTEHYGLDLLNSAWVYIAIGVGSYMASTWLRFKRGWVSERQDSTIAFIGFFVLALTRLAFMKLPDFSWALLAMAVGGICNGANAVVTQSLRRKICSAERLPEFIGLELLVGRLADWCVSTLLLLLFSKKLIGYEEGIWASMASLLVLSVSMYLFRRNYVDPSRARAA
jgi:predicted MFS family arabinose efflux permease